MQKATFYVAFFYSSNSGGEIADTKKDFLKKEVFKKGE